MTLSRLNACLRLVFLASAVYWAVRGDVAGIVVSLLGAGWTSLPWELR